MTTYYYEIPDVFFFGPGSLEADSDEEAKTKAPKNYEILYKESDTPDGLPFIEI